MTIHIVSEKATSQQIKEMREAIGYMIKLAVDIERGILAGGGKMHSDCEKVLLLEGSRQEHVWGADWLPDDNEVGFESLINIRPSQGNFKLEIQDPSLRAQVERIVRQRLEA
jgi:hypothetical protein